MSASDGTYTYDRLAADGGPYVPDEADFGEEMVDDAQNPPADDEPNAGLFNERRSNLAGLNRCTWWCTLWVEYDGGSGDYNVTAVDAMGTLVTTANFTPTSGATGVVVITWTAGDLPAMARKPHAWCTDDHGSAYGEVTTANSITVYLADLAGTADDLNFAVELR